MQPPRDIRWAAGLFEGEGSIGIATQRVRYPNLKYPRLQLQSTDEDVAREFRRIVDEGKVTGPYQYHAWKPVWSWTVSGAGARRAMSRLLPYLCERRSARWEEVNATSTT